MNIPKLFISEFLIALLIGAVPLLILVNSRPNSKAVEILASLNPGDPIVIYFFYLLLLHLAIWGVNRFILKTNQMAFNLLSTAHNFSYKIGFTIHSIYRVIAGSIPAAIGLLAYEHGFDINTLIVSATSILLVFGSLFMCCFLTWLSEKTAPKQKWL